MIPCPSLLPNLPCPTPECLLCPAQCHGRLWHLPQAVHSARLTPDIPCWPRVPQTPGQSLAGPLWLCQGQQDGRRRSQHSPHARVQHGPGHGEHSAGWAPGRLFQLLVPRWDFLPVEEPAKETSDVGQDGEAHSVSPHPPSGARCLLFPALS